MDASRQVVRWSIPGAVLIMALVLDEFLVSAVFRHTSPALTVARQVDAGMAVLLVALGIPLGFLMNQIYFNVWDGIVTVWPFAVPVDRGKDVFDRLGWSGIPYAVLACDHQLEVDLEPRVEKIPRHFLGHELAQAKFKLRPNSRDARRAYKWARKKNWRAVRWLMIYGADDGTREILRAEWGGRNDAYHALGGSRFAVWTAAFVCWAYNAAAHFGSLTTKPYASAGAGLIVLGLTLGSDRLLRRSRYSTFNAMQEVIVDGLRKGPLDNGR